MFQNACRQRLAHEQIAQLFTVQNCTADMAFLGCPRIKDHIPFKADCSEQVV